MNLKYYCVYVQFNWLKRIPSTYEIVVRVGLHVSYIWIVISVGQRSLLISGRSSVQVGYDPLGLQCWMPSPRSTLKGLGSIPNRSIWLSSVTLNRKKCFFHYAFIGVVDWCKGQHTQSLPGYGRFDSCIHNMKMKQQIIKAGREARLDKLITNLCVIKL